MKIHCLFFLKLNFVFVNKICVASVAEYWRLYTKNLPDPIIWIILSIQWYRYSQYKIHKSILHGSSKLYTYDIFKFRHDKKIQTYHPQTNLWYMNNPVSFLANKTKKEQNQWYKVFQVVREFRDDRYLRLIWSEQ